MREAVVDLECGGEVEVGRRLGDGEGVGSWIRFMAVGLMRGCVRGC